jgi:hypothetical protein
MLEAYRQFTYSFNKIGQLKFWLIALFLLAASVVLFVFGDNNMAAWFIGFAIILAGSVLIFDIQLVRRVRFWQRFGLWPGWNESSTVWDIIDSHVRDVMYNLAEDLDKANKAEEKLQREVKLPGRDRRKDLEKVRDVRLAAKRAYKRYTSDQRLAAELGYGSWKDYKDALKSR